MSIWFSDRCQQTSIEASAMDNFVRRFQQFLNFSIKRFILLLIAAYRTVASAWLGGACRFEPSCSAYASEAFQKHSFFTALKLSSSRIMKCRPGGGFGFDPVPPSPQDSNSFEQLCRGHHHG
jgi:putative membrane protein insertion efficiency factor